MVTLRRFTPEDAPSIHQLIYPDMTKEQIVDMIGEWESGVCQGRYFGMFAVECDGRIVGSVSLYEHSPSVASAGIEIVRHERGKGIATKAMETLLAAAIEKGYRIIMDQVSTDNHASIRLHEKLGFESDRYVYRNHRNHDIYLFLKPLY